MVFCIFINQKMGIHEIRVCLEVLRWKNVDAFVKCQEAKAVVKIIHRVKENWYVGEVDVQ